MPHRRFTHLFRRRAPTVRSLAAIIACGLPRLLHGQAAPASQPAILPLYRTPVIALVQPPSGGAVPQDKPVVIFRFAQGEAGDGVDVKSFGVTVDGVDITAAFQIAGGDAWGSLAGLRRDVPLSLGVHGVVARICSERGACGTVSAAVSVAQGANADAPSTEAPKRRDRLLDVLLRATKKLLL